jgi:Arc/MetJ-type ribon-helix-helix transcriptional regulator
MTEGRTVQIPEELYTQLEAMVEGSEFASVEAYVQFVLQELVAGDKTEGQLSPAEERLVEERLRGLGYIE